MKKNKIFLSIATILIAIGIYPLTAYLLSFATIGDRLPGAPPEKESDVLLYISATNVHVDIIIPANHPSVREVKLFQTEKVFGKFVEANWLEVGWGDRNFFMEIPSWDKLDWSIVLNSLFLPTESAMHVNFLKTLNGRRSRYPVYVDIKDFNNFIIFLKSSFFIADDGIKKLSDYSYYGTDRFFKSVATYHLFKTCNMWANEALKLLNIKTSYWSPFVFGITKHLRKE